MAEEEYIEVFIESLQMLQGTYTALVTPFRMERLISRLLRKSLNGRLKMGLMDWSCG